MLTGRAARGTTWTVIDEWVDEWSGVAPAKVPARKAPAKRTAAKNTAAKKTPARKTAATKASADTIGSNPSRRYGSAGSRALGQR
jgi:polyhydroxyalkanoate synthase